MGAARSAAKDESPAWGAFVDALVGAGTEGAMALLPGVSKIPRVTRSVGEVAAKVRGARAGEASVAPRIDKTIDLIKSRLPTKPFLNVPALDKTKLLTLDEAAKALKAKGLTDEQFQIARAQLVHALNTAEREAVKQGVRAPGQAAPTAPYAGSIFGKFAPKEHFRYQPTGGEKFAEGLVRGTESPSLRALADTLATEDVGGPRGNLPIGGAALLGAGSGLVGLAKHLINVPR
jgi:hypothetical protein